MSAGSLHHREPARVRVEGGLFVCEFECKATEKTERFESIDEHAVKRGAAHFAGRWNGAIAHLMAAGLNDKEQVIALRRVAPRFRKEALVEVRREEDARAGERTAKELLLRHLTRDQERDFKRFQWFEVEVTRGPSKRGENWEVGLYRISTERAYNVTHVASGVRFCVVAAEAVPIYDQMLTQKLLLETDPAPYFKKANKSGVGEGALDVAFSGCIVGSVATMCESGQFAYSTAIINSR